MERRFAGRRLDGLQPMRKSVGGLREGSGQAAHKLQASVDRSP